MAKKRAWEQELEMAHYYGISPRPKDLVEMEEQVNFEVVEPPGIRSPQGRVWADEYAELFAQELEQRGLELVSLYPTDDWGIFYVIRRRHEKKCWLVHSRGPFREREVIHPVKENGTPWIQGRDD